MNLKLYYKKVISEFLTDDIHRKVEHAAGSKENLELMFIEIVSVSKFYINSTLEVSHIVDRFLAGWHACENGESCNTVDPAHVAGYGLKYACVYESKLN